MTLTNILLIAVFLGSSGAIYLQWRSQRSGSNPQELARLRAELEQKIKRVGELESIVEKERTEKDTNAGKAKQLFAQLKDAESDAKAINYENNALKKQVAEYEAAEEARMRELDDRLGKLHRAEKSLEDERMRVRREDEERQQQILEERDRIWNDHEQDVLSTLSGICKNPDIAFTYYDNSSLPDGFDGSVKPDFMIGFLQQYVVFDAKVSRSDNFQNYITTNVKNTAKKYKGRKEIYPTVFFVVPTDAIAELKRRSFTEDGITFYVVSPESLEPILMSLKKITTYDLAEQLDPQERENIIKLVAMLDHHINVRNAYDIIMAKHGANVLSDAKDICGEIVDQVQQEKAKMSFPQFKKADAKRLVSSIDECNKEIEELVQPKAAIEV